MTFRYVDATPLYTAIPKPTISKDVLDGKAPFTLDNVPVDQETLNIRDEIVKQVAGLLAAGHNVTIRSGERVMARYFADGRLPEFGRDHF